ncbi:hypothetical protein LCGC14_0386850 [marine sediment metagenome]|uniref:Homeodomain phBC6A51-type domain-containing protein n=1 Tax=marine sediment metagenome TaxID=412755 RepID=A0A0F9TIU0_9ZZZZ
MPKKNGDRYTAKEVADAAINSRGFVSKTADQLGCVIQTVHNYQNKYATVAAAFKEARERRHDYVENALMKRIDSEDTTAIIFYLKTQAKQRGYVERSEVQHSGSVVVNWDDDND